MEIKVEAFEHSLLCGEYVGGKMLLNELEEAQKDFPKMPGLGLAVAVAKAKLADMHSMMLARNLALACRQGFNPDDETLTMTVKDDGIYLATEKEKE